MQSVVLVALAAAIGNMLQGWDNATIAGAVIYIKKEFHLEKEPKIEGLIVAMSLIGATLITTFSGPVSDRVGRRSMLVLSSLLYFLSSIVMFWSPNVYVLLFARLLDGFGIGLAVTLVPIYISETAPSEIRGLLNTFPQFCGSGGMFLSYCLVFAMSLQESPSWRLMLGVLSIPSIIYFVLAAFFLPESPRWLVSKGRMDEARQVLQRLRGREDVSGELALLVEGLGVGKDTSIEEYVIGPDNEESENGHELPRKDQIKLYGPEDGQSWMAKPVKGQSSLALASRHGSMLQRGGSLVDPVVTLFGSIHEKLPSENMNVSSRSMIFPNMGSILGMMGRQDSQWDPERNNEDSSDQDESLNSPLLSPQTTEPDECNQRTVGTMHRRQSSLFMANVGETATATSIGGGWQLAWKYNDKVGADGKKVNGGLQRMYIHEENAHNKNNNNIGISRRGSLLSFNTEADVHDQENGYIQAAALVSQASMIPGVKGETAMFPKEVKAAGPGWRELWEPGVKRALMVGVGLQILQQFAGINGVMYYTPQILEETGVSGLLKNLGISAESSSLLISALTTFLMLPCIIVSMRSLMLSTIPILILSLLTLVIGSLVKLGGTTNALMSTISVMVYLSCFVMGFGAIPNILCSEIFPTSVRGLCITICALTFWICDIIVTYTLPVMLKSLGLAGVFGIYAFVCAVAWVFVYLKVPETKGMPLEVISEFFSVGAKQQDLAASFLSDG
ncbi:monosaccharide-sensing protein 3 isoform X2 [Eutrema salsugineum]|uniref:monosaccharide-sensing protein 3 isoform X2 n=1 Tax=Eutrema salsugineum TaxID=72664 RepID=UPI000CED23F8|nr:monosaccharide-sensing protein 3 isoform X2 [Eutrema salsugineum]